MSRRRKTKAVAVVAAAAAVVAAGGAVAATRDTSPAEERQALLADAARRLDVTPAALADALEEAMAARVDAAVADGRLTREHGDALKDRIREGGIPLGIPHRLGHRGRFGHLEAAAQYLGVEAAALRSELRSGKSLAQVARDRGRSVDGLVDALVADAERRLDEAVAAGRLTEARKRELVAGIRDAIAARVDRVRSDEDRRFGFRGGGRGAAFGLEGGTSGLAPTF